MNMSRATRHQELANGSHLCLFWTWLWTEQGRRRERREDGGRTREEGAGKAGMEKEGRKGSKKGNKADGTEKEEREEGRVKGKDGS